MINLKKTTFTEHIENKGFVYLNNTANTTCASQEDYNDPSLPSTTTKSEPLKTILSPDNNSIEEDFPPTRYNEKVENPPYEDSSYDINAIDEEQEEFIQRLIDRFTNHDEDEEFEEAFTEVSPDEFFTELSPDEEEIDILEEEVNNEEEYDHEGYCKLEQDSTFTINNVIYNIPNLPYCEDYAISNFCLRILDNSINIKDGYRHFYISKHDTINKVNIDINGKDFSANEFLDISPTVLLYREGDTEPITLCRINNTSSSRDKHFTLTCPTPLTPGNYLLFFPHAHPSGHIIDSNTTEAGYCTRFSIFIKYEEIDMPVPKGKCLIRWHKDTCCKAWNKGVIEMETDIHLYSKTFLNFSVLCYNEDNILIIETSHTGYMNTAPTVLLDCFRPWLPGGYTAVIAVNGLPITQVTFDIKENGTLSPGCLSEFDNPDNYFYRAALVMDLKHRHWWTALGRQLGVAEAKQKLLNIYLQKNTLLNQGKRLESELVIFSAPEEFDACNNAENTIPLWKIGKDKVIISSCEKQNDFDSLCHIDSGNEENTNLAIILQDTDKLLYKNCDTMRFILKALNHPKMNISIIICTSDCKLKQILIQHPELAEHIKADKHIQIQNLSKNESAYRLWHNMNEFPIYFSDEVESEVLQKFTQYWEPLELHRWTDYSTWFFDVLMDNMRKRLNYDKDYPITWEHAASCDLQLEEYWKNLAANENVPKQDDIDDTNAFNDAMSTLNQMVGLHSLKKNLNDLFTLMQFYKGRKELGLPYNDKTPRHMVFTGNPGTGKTTVARLIGKIYHSMGLLSSDKVYVVERRNLVSDFIGGTEKNMNKILKESEGMVLFIDEAYTLFNGSNDRQDFGFRVIESLLTTLAEENANRVVILAGYKDDMQKLMQSNRGLESRFCYHIHFEDYSAQELLEIAVQKLENEFYTLSKEAKDALLTFIQHTCEFKNEEFGNARWVHQLINNVIMPNMARRVIMANRPADEELYTHILAEDIPTIQYNPKSNKKNIRKIGFTA